MAPIRTILFDFGNVIGFFDHGHAVRKLSAYTDMPPVELALELYGGPLEDDYDRGVISTAEYVRAARLNGRLSCTDEEFLDAFCDIFWPNHEVCRLVPRLKPRYRLVLASNTNEAHSARFRRTFADTLKYFDALGMSFRAGSRKPHREFYEHCQTLAGCAPDECLYVDDLPANVEAARKFGWQAIVYRDYPDLLARLLQHGVEVAPEPPGG
jgi:putative hydrolase of the HAD superfamily